MIFQVRIGDFYSYNFVWKIHIISSFNCFFLCFFPENDPRISQYKERIYEETLFLVCDGLFSLVEVCEAVIILSKFYSNDKQKSLEMADKLWAGIVGKAPKELDVVSVPIGLSNFT